MGWADFCLNSARGFHLPAEHALSSSRLRSAFALWRASASVSRPRSEDSEALRMQVFTPHRVYAVLNLAPLHRGCETPEPPPCSWLQVAARFRNMFVLHSACTSWLHLSRAGRQQREVEREVQARMEAEQRVRGRVRGRCRRAWRQSRG